MRKYIFILTVKLIRKYFSEGISVVVDREENIIAYRWTWTKELDDAVLKNRVKK